MPGSQLKPLFGNPSIDSSLFFRSRYSSAVRPSRSFAVSVSISLLLRFRNESDVKPSKSPVISVSMLLLLRSRLLIASSMRLVTKVQVLTPDTRTSSALICSVRPHTPPSRSSFLTGSFMNAATSFTAASRSGLAVGGV